MSQNASASVGAFCFIKRMDQNSKEHENGNDHIHHARRQRDSLASIRRGHRTTLRRWEGGIAIRPGEWASGMYEDWEKTDRTALLSDINRMACRPMGTIGVPTIGEVRAYGDCLWNVED